MQAETIWQQKVFYHNWKHAFKVNKLMEIMSDQISKPFSAFWWNSVNQTALFTMFS